MSPDALERLRAGLDKLPAMVAQHGARALLAYALAAVEEAMALEGAGRCLFWFAMRLYRACRGVAGESFAVYLARQVYGDFAVEDE